MWLQAQGLGGAKFRVRVCARRDWKIQPGGVDGIDPTTTDTDAENTDYIWSAFSEPVTFKPEAVSSLVIEREKLTLRHCQQAEEAQEKVILATAVTMAATAALAAVVEIQTTPEWMWVELSRFELS